MDVQVGICERVLFAHFAFFAIHLFQKLNLADDKRIRCHRVHDWENVHYRSSVRGDASREYARGRELCIPISNDQTAHLGDM